MKFSIEAYTLIIDLLTQSLEEYAKLDESPEFLKHIKEAIQEVEAIGTY